MKRDILDAPGWRLLIEMRVLAALMVPLAAGAVEQQAMQGHVPAAAARLRAVDRLTASTRLDLAIGLRLLNTAGLSNLLHQFYNLASPLYQQFLTPDQFTAR